MKRLIDMVDYIFSFRCDIHFERLNRALGPGMMPIDNEAMQQRRPVSPIPSASSCNHHVFFVIPSPGYLILFNLSISLQHSLERLRKENQKRPPRESPRIPASGLRLPCIHPCRTSRPSGRYRSSSKMRREIDEMAQPYR